MAGKWHSIYRLADEAELSSTTVTEQRCKSKVIEGLIYDNIACATPPLCNRAGFRDNAAKSGKPGHNRDIGPNSRTVPAKPGHLATMRRVAIL